MKRDWRHIILLLLLLVAGCEQTTSYPEPTVTATVEEQVAGFEELQNLTAGVSFVYPEEWYVATSANRTIASPEMEVIEQNNYRLGPFFLIASGTPQQLLSMGLGGSSSGEALYHLHNSVADSPGFLVTKPAYERDVGEQTIWMEHVSLEMNPGQIFRLWMMAYVTDEVAATGILGAPESTWDQYEPEFERMVNSLDFSSPAPTVEVVQGELEPGASYEATLDLGEVDVWELPLETPAFIILQVEALEEWDPMVAVVNNEGELVAFNDNASSTTRDAQIAGLWLPGGESYGIHVQSSSGTGAYRVAVLPAENLRHELPASGTVEDTLEPLSSRHLWTFEGEAGQTISVAVDGQGFDAYIELYSPDGALLAEDDDSGTGTDAELKILLPEDGLYNLIVRAQDPATATDSSYSLVLTRQ